MSNLEPAAFAIRARVCLLFCFMKQNTDLGPAHSFRLKEAIK